MKLLILWVCRFTHRKGNGKNRLRSEKSPRIHFRTRVQLPSPPPINIANLLWIGDVFSCFYTIKLRNGCWFFDVCFLHPNRYPLEVPLTAMKAKAWKVAVWRLALCKQKYRETAWSYRKLRKSLHRWWKWIFVREKCKIKKVVSDGMAKRNAIKLEW